MTELMSQYLFHQVSHNEALPSAKGYSHVRKRAWVIANVSMWKCTSRLAKRSITLMQRKANISRVVTKNPNSRQRLVFFLLFNPPKDDVDVLDENRSPDQDCKDLAITPVIFLIHGSHFGLSSNFNLSIAERPDKFDVVERIKYSISSKNDSQDSTA